MKITKQFLKHNSACSEGYKWFFENFPDDGDDTIVFDKLLTDNHWDWLRWCAVRMMTHSQKVEWAIFCAEQVIGIYEKKFQDDQRPRKAIVAARAYLKSPNAENKKTASAASAAAASAADASDAAAYAAYAAASAAAAADAAASAAADAAAYAAYASAYASASAYARKKLIIVLVSEAVKIINQPKE